MADHQEDEDIDELELVPLTDASNHVEQWIPPASLTSLPTTSTTPSKAKSSPRSRRTDVRLTRMRAFQAMIWIFMLGALVTMQKYAVGSLSFKPPIVWRHKPNATSTNGDWNTDPHQQQQQHDGGVTESPSNSPTTSQPTPSPTTTVIHSTPLPTLPPHSATSHKNNHTVQLPPLPSSNETDQFVQRYCSLGKEPWYPDSHSWHLRAPRAILAGALDAGLSQVAAALQEHPQVLPRTTMGTMDFFLPTVLSRYQTNINITTSEKRTNVYVARSHLYAQVDARPFQLHNTSIALDVSPRYLFHGRPTATALQCVVPWTQLIFCFCNPVDRVYQHWMHERASGLTTPLEDWMAADLQLLQELGFLTREPQLHLLQQNWTRYKLLPGNKGVGKSLYLFTLLEWLETLVSVGKYPHEQMHIIIREQWEAQVQKQYRQLTDFLGLAHHTTTWTPTDKRTGSGMDAVTRRQLEQFFAPYNQLLVGLLRQYGFDIGDWAALWGSR